MDVGGRISFVEGGGRKDFRCRLESPSSVALVIRGEATGVGSWRQFRAEFQIEDRERRRGGLGWAEKSRMGNWHRSRHTTNCGRASGQAKQMPCRPASIRRSAPPTHAKTAGLTPGESCCGPCGRYHSALSQLSSVNGRALDRMKGGRMVQTTPLPQFPSYISLTRMRNYINTGSLKYITGPRIITYIQ